MSNKNHFLISYPGNKRREVNNIFDQIETKLLKNKITTIIEPFCGSSAFSYFLSLKYPMKYKYILNDNNHYLIELYNIARDEDKLKNFVLELNELVIDLNRIKYNDLIKKEGLKYWIIKHTIYAIRAGLYPLEGSKKIKSNYDNLLTCPIINFLRTENIIILNDDAINIMNTYKDDKKCLIFLDPPYLNSCNDFYLDAKCNIYEYLYNNQINTLKSYVVLCLENNWIIQLLFKRFIKCEYAKQYELSKKKTTHMIISN